MSLVDRLRALRRSRDDIQAEDEVRSAAGRGTIPIGGLQPRSRARVSGVLQAVTYRPAADAPVLVGRLFDGTGSVDLVWLGRRTIVDVDPGTHLEAEGMVVAGRTRPTIFNPAYVIIGGTA